MSALKSAAANNSPSSSSKGCTDQPSSSLSSSSSSSSSSKPKSSSSKDSSRDKDRKNVSSSSSSTSLSFSGSGSGRQSPKTKSSSGKLKQLDLIPTSSSETPPTSLPSSGSSTPPSGSSDLGKSATAQQQQQARNRKGSLSAVIDKLKNAQHCTDDAVPGAAGGGGGGGGSGGGGGGPGGGGGGGSGSGSEAGSGGSQKERTPSSSSTKTSGEGKSIGKSSSPSIDAKNPAEYMVKHSSDGMKITINKTRAKDSKTGGNVKISSGATSSVSGSLGVSVSSSGSGNGSPKTHTGLKPGVNSGPASKKPQTQSSIKVATPGSGMSSSVGNKLGVQGQKLSSAPKSMSGSSSTGSGSLLTKSTTSKSSSGSPKMSSSGATDLSRNRDKPRIPKSSEKSGGLFSSKSGADARKASPSALREESESERAFKVLAAHVSPSNMPSFPPQLVVEGLIKALDTKFQIPKLSARANASADTADKKSSADKPVQPIPSVEHPSAKLLVDNLATSKLETKIPSLANAVASPLTNNPKSSADILDPASSIQGRRDAAQTKPDNLSVTATALPLMNLGAAMSPSSHLILPTQSLTSTSPPVAAAPLDSDVPTNLSMSTSDGDARDSLKDLTTATSISRPASTTNSQQPFLKSSAPSASGPPSGVVATTPDDISAGSLSTILPIDVAIVDDPIVTPKALTYSSSVGVTGGSSNPIAGTVSTSESLNLSTKPADAALSKYNKTSDEARKSLEKVTIPVVSPAAGSTSPIESSASVGKSSAPVIGSNSQEVAEMLLDFSTPKDVVKVPIATVPERAMSLQSAPARRNTPPPPPPPPPPPAFPPSPSVSVHIVKSPAPSPRVIPSPHSAASPCITDDELMDEALVGMGK